MSNSLRNILASLILLGMLLGSSQAQAITTAPTTRSFYLDWSGALWGNSAEGHGILTVYDDLFSNSVDYAWLIPGVEIADFTLSVSGASSGNGTFGLTDFDAFLWSTKTPGESLDLSQELIGQTTTGGPWGSDFGLDSNTGDFNLIAALASGAPFTTGSFIMATDEGNGEQMNLISFRPVPIPAAFWMFGSALLGLIGVGHKRRT